MREIKAWHSSQLSMNPMCEMESEGPEGLRSHKFKSSLG